MKRLYLIFFLSFFLLAVQAFASEPEREEETEVEFDLSVMPANIAYAQLCAMQKKPEEYEGKLIRLSGVFNYSERREHGVVILTDTTGCCETSIDFTCARQLEFPEDFPQLYSRFTLTGRFEISEDDDVEYLLTDAVIEE